MDTTGTAAGEAALERLDGDAVERFVAGIHGEVVRPSAPEYEEARAIWNGTVDRHPALIVRCSGTADVVEAVGFARENDLPLAVRGGGHNVAGTAMCDGGVVVDLSAMNGVIVDPDARRAWVQGGATIGDVDRETQLHGLAVPLGVVSETGVAGLTLSGGVGHLRREHGLSLDSLVAAEVVTADGEVLTADTETNADLFWALRGGGGNFGVVTTFEYRLHEVGPEVPTLFVWHPAAAAVDALRAFRTFAATAPRAASVVAFAAVVPELDEFPETAWGSLAVAFLGCYDGSAADADAAFAPIREAAEPVADLSGTMAYTDLQTLLDEDYPDGRNYYWKSTYVDELTDEVVEVVARAGETMPSALSTVDLWHLGGAIDDVAPEATAYPHRGRPYMLTFEANWEDDADTEANVAWVREGIADARATGVASGAYGNFPGAGEETGAPLFGENYERLVRVKRRYDPANLFRLNQNVDPTD
ncbi:FAD-binding oxidoreductase [Halobaculum lipolyticum]|uniref:FAD-binding oxidoreductase n=1 Tax=Halobaculum lipolyticum TaxID=3032001 RepID=A0ABD5WD12_9EURY|nr:FAD-binding oxidoreductase [Halobaculum sp. DT31]